MGQRLRLGPCLRFLVQAWISDSRSVPTQRWQSTACLFSPWRRQNSTRTPTARSRLGEGSHCCWTLLWRVCSHRERKGLRKAAGSRGRRDSLLSDERFRGLQGWKRDEYPRPQNARVFGTWCEETPKVSLNSDRLWELIYLWHSLRTQTTLSSAGPKWPSTMTWILMSLPSV